MSHKPYIQTPTVNGNTSGKQAHANTPVSGQMKIGEAHCVGDRKGRFSGEGYDLRNKAGRFSSGTRLAKADQAGGTKGAGHASQPKGHKSVVKGKKG